VKNSSSKDNAVSHRNVHSTVVATPPGSMEKTLNGVVGEYRITVGNCARSRRLAEFMESQSDSSVDITERLSSSEVSQVRIS